MTATLALALAACACSGGGPPACVLGSSDPTLRPADAWEAAAEAAMAEAARAALATRVRAGERVGSAGADAVAIHETRGHVTGVAVAGWWLDPGRRGATPGTVWAVACPDGAGSDAGRRLPGAFPAEEGWPDWLRRPAAGCAIGLSGPTIAPADAVEAARRDARRRLALSLGAEVDDAVVELRGVTWEFPAWRPTPEAAAAAGDVTGEEPVFVDAKGKGPLRTPGLVYARACLARGVQGVRNGSRGGTQAGTKEGTP